MRQKVLKQELRVFKDTVRKLFEMIIMFDHLMQEITKKEIYTYDQILIVEKVATDLISLTIVYRDNVFFSNGSFGNVNKYVTLIGDTVSELDDLGRAADAIAKSMSDAKDLCSEEQLDDSYKNHLTTLMFSSNIQLGAKLFEIRKRYQQIRSALLGLRYIVMLDFTRILMGVDLIRDYKDTNKQTRKLVIKALPINEFAKLTHKGGDSDER
ncbi:MAG: hypothetical protein J5614_01050 [Paludibacteraceae bacterium]|nr:hypothetical protein [Paludibacteraceae bacterium]